MKTYSFAASFVICIFMPPVDCCQADLMTTNAYFATSGPGHPLYDWSALLVAPSTVDRQSGFSVIIGKVGNVDYEFSLGLAASAYGLFPAVPGQEFTPPDVYSWPSAFEPGYNPVSFGAGETKYYAFWADVGGPSVNDVPDIGDDYGWVSLTYTGTELVVSNSATALGGGIIVGTYIQIPEPSTVLLVVFGLIWLYRRICPI